MSQKCATCIFPSIFKLKLVETMSKRFKSIVPVPRKLILFSVAVREKNGGDIICVAKVGSRGELRGGDITQGNILGGGNIIWGVYLCS